MPETIVLCKEGTINSYLSALIVATNMKKAGEDISVVFMQEGLAALVDKKYRYAPGLEGYAEDIKKNAAEMGVPSDPFELIKMASSAGVPLYACFAWMKLLGGKPPRFEIPAGLQKLELKDLLQELSKAKKVITL
ncbi:MAG: DsrE family protein [Methanophagales archaeon]|nr:DsrE family protein [Methanophagales archaeon]